MSTKPTVTGPPPTLRTFEKWLFGLVLPVIVQVAGMLVIAAGPTRAGAAEFAGLGVFFMLLFSLPFVLVLNPLIAVAGARTRKSCLLRGLIVPALVLLAAILYQLGLLDGLI